MQYYLAVRFVVAMTGIGGFSELAISSYATRFLEKQLYEVTPLAPCYLLQSDGDESYRRGPHGVYGRARPPGVIR